MQPDAPGMMEHIVAQRELGALPPCSAAEFRGIMARRSSQNYSSTHWVNIEQEASEEIPVTHSPVASPRERRLTKCPLLLQGFHNSSTETIRLALHAGDLATSHAVVA